MTEIQQTVDAHAVSRWLAALGVEFTAPLRFQRIGLGQSNLTYRVTDDANRAWVLRRPPLGHLLASAHLQAGVMVVVVTGQLLKLSDRPRKTLITDSRNHRAFRERSYRVEHSRVLEIYVPDS